MFSSYPCSEFHDACACHSNLQLYSGFCDATVWGILIHEDGQKTSDVLFSFSINFSLCLISTNHITIPYFWIRTSYLVWESHCLLAKAGSGLLQVWAGSVVQCLSRWHCCQLEALSDSPQFSTAQTCFGQGEDSQDACFPTTDSSFVLIHGRDPIVSSQLVRLCTRQKCLFALIG